MSGRGVDEGAGFVRACSCDATGNSGVAYFVWGDVEWAQQA